MKCPYRFNIVQKTSRGTRFNEEDEAIGDNTTLIETQEFGECFEKECAVWNKEKNKCERN